MDPHCPPPTFHSEHYGNLSLISVPLQRIKLALTIAAVSVLENRIKVLTFELLGRSHQELVENVKGSLVPGLSDNSSFFQ